MLQTKTLSSILLFSLLSGCNNKTDDTSKESLAICESKLEFTSKLLDANDDCENGGENEICSIQVPSLLSTTPSDRAYKTGWLDKADNTNKEDLSKYSTLFIGDSITEYWKYSSRGLESWNHYFGDFSYNMGVSGDRTQHLLWRFAYGNLNGATPELVVLMIGTNNIGAGNSIADTKQGIIKILQQIRRDLPLSNVLLLGILPRGQLKDDPIRKQITNINLELSQLNRFNKINYLDVGHYFLDENGNMIEEYSSDFLHPTIEGYRILAEALENSIYELRNTH